MIEPYINLIREAFRAIEPAYFRIQTTYEPTGIVRERAFCYELYHQIRLRMHRHRLSLNGEIDKRGHIDFRQKDQRNPDFVFHIPGTHAGNTLVVEVKGRLDIDPAEIIKDLNTLLTFVDRYGYEGGVFLLYNHSFEELADRLGREMGAVAKSPAASSVVILSMKVAQTQVEAHLLSERHTVDQ
jgi:hypothetical protein